MYVVAGGPKGIVFTACIDDGWIGEAGVQNSVDVSRCPTTQESTEQRGILNHFSN
jgi:hypothetical protein